MMQDMQQIHELLDALTPERMKRMAKIIVGMLLIENLAMFLTHPWQGADCGLTSSETRLPHCSAGNFSKPEIAQHMLLNLCRTVNCDCVEIHGTRYICLQISQIRALALFYPITLICDCV